MRIIKPYTEFIGNIDPIDDMIKIEQIGRVCYKSENKIGEQSYEYFIKKLIKNGHEAMLEHGSISVKFVCDRGVSHELVRHRFASFAQESTRYCNYAGDKFGKDLTFIKPCFFQDTSEKYGSWAAVMQYAELYYIDLIEQGASPQEARSVLPNSIKTEVIMTANFREWRHFFKLRAIGTTGKPHPQMKELTVPLLRRFCDLYPPIFDDLYKIWLEKQ